MRVKRPDLLFIISGPSGVGKNTLAGEVTAEGVAIRAVTATTRSPRAGEEDGEDYIFIGEDKFLRWRDDGRFLEWNSYGGNWYGTPLSSVNEASRAGKPILLVIDVNGALKVKRTDDRINLVFVMPPSMHALEERLRGRGDEDEGEIKKRLEIAEKEIREKDDYDYIIVNKDIVQAASEIKKIIVDNTGEQ